MVVIVDKKNTGKYLSRPEYKFQSRRIVDGMRYLVKLQV